MMNEISRLGHYCGVNGVKPSDLSEEMIKRICAGEFDPPCIGRGPTFETIPYKEWQEMLKNAKHIPDGMLKFPDKPSGPTKDAYFDDSDIICPHGHKPKLCKTIGGIPFIGKAPTCDIISNKEWEERLKNVNPHLPDRIMQKIEESKKYCPNRYSLNHEVDTIKVVQPGSDRHNTQFGIGINNLESVLKSFNITKEEYMRAREEECKFNRDIVNKKLNKFEYIVKPLYLLFIGLIFGFICGWLAHV